MSDATVNEATGVRSIILPRWVIWFGFFIIHAITTSLIWILTKWYIAIPWFIFGTILVMWRGWNTIDEMWEWRLKVLGSDVGYPLKKGLNFIFPYFHLMEIESMIYMGVQPMGLLLDSVEGTRGGGAVEFTDGSAPVLAEVFFRFIDSYKATYAVNDVLQAIEKNGDAALRAYLGAYSIDEASMLKIHFDTHKILNGVLVADSNGTITEKGKPEIKKKMDDLVKEFESWGVEITRIVVRDVILPERIQKLREKVLEALKKAEAAVHLAKEKTTLAEADKQVRILEGDGLQEQVKKMVEAKVDPNIAADLLAKLALYGNINNNAVIIESGTEGKAGAGAKFGAGFNKTAGISNATEREE